MVKNKDEYSECNYRLTLILLSVLMIIFTGDFFFIDCVQANVFFARVTRLLDEGVQADLLFCLLSGHSSEHWPSPKLKPLVSDWSQHSDPRGDVDFESLEPDIV